MSASRWEGADETLRSEFSGNGTEIAVATNSEDQLFMDKCFEALAEEGYRPNMKENCIEFKVNYTTFYVWFTEKGVSVFQMQTLYKYDIPSLSRADALRLANRRNASFTDVKTAVMDADFMPGSTVILFRSECHFPNIFDVMFKDKIASLQESVRLYNQEVLSEEIMRIARS